MCPAGLRVTVFFGDAPVLGIPSRTARPATAGGYPRVFDLARADPAAGGGYWLATPALAGRPHGDGAQAALGRSISVRLLALLAGELSGAARTGQDYFLDALVARAEARWLGSPAASKAPAAQDFIPIGLLWQTSFVTHDFFHVEAGGWRTDVPARQEVLDFLNFVLVNEPPSADGALLAHLRGPAGASVDQWLAESLGSQEIRVSGDAWENLALAGLNADPPPDWRPYEGLVMACSDGLYQVQAGLPRPVGRQVRPGLATQGIGDVSPDGRYLAILSAGEPTAGARLVGYAVTLTVLDLDTAREAIVESGPLWAVLGWSATGQLIYAAPDANDDGINPDGTVNLMAYDPAAGRSVLLVDEPTAMATVSMSAWSADHSALVWTMGGFDPDGPTQGPLIEHPLARYTFGIEPGLQRLGVAGSQAALAPDGSQVAYVNALELRVSNLNIISGREALNVFDPASATVTRLAAAEVGQSPETNVFWLPQWSPDGKQLAWTAGTPNQVHTAPAGGGAIRAWAIGSQPIWLNSFSPDGRYLMVEDNIIPEPMTQAVQNYLSLKHFWLFDQQAQTVEPPSSLWAYSTLWLPGGHALLAAGAAGVTRFDPATGAAEWLGDWERCQLRQSIRP